MKVLLSIRPEFALRIFDGSKRYEYRRSIFKRGAVTKVIVYASAPIQKVIGEFEIGDILHDEPLELWARTQSYAGISQDRFLAYFSNIAKGYAIVIRSPTMYSAPLPLNHFMVSSPPQSFVYLR
jgi:predicted transcriptional regulator